MTVLTKDQDTAENQNHIFQNKVQYFTQSTSLNGCHLCLNYFALIIKKFHLFKIGRILNSEYFTLSHVKRQRNGLSNPLMFFFFSFFWTQDDILERICASETFSKLHMAPFLHLENESNYLFQRISMRIMQNELCKTLSMASGTQQVLLFYQFPQKQSETVILM